MVKKSGRSKNCKFGTCSVDFDQVQPAATELRDPSRTMIVRRNPGVEGVSTLIGAKIAIGDNVLG